MLVRRTLFAFLVTFACALAVFSLPRFVSNTILGATTHSQGKDTVPAAATPPAPTAPPVVVAARSLAVRLRGVLGMVAILAIGFGLSSNRKRISRRVVAWGLGLQLTFAVFVLRIPVGQWLFSKLGAAVPWLFSFSFAGSSFVFGEIRKQHSGICVVFSFPGSPSALLLSGLFPLPHLPSPHPARAHTPASTDY